ncbi:hypothetical protein SFUMM280S_07977 [Streptomyces fumanus]
MADRPGLVPGFVGGSIALTIVGRRRGPGEENARAKTQAALAEPEDEDDPESEEDDEDAEEDEDEEDDDLDDAGELLDEEPRLSLR